MLASYEALANSIEHAYRERGGVILLAAQRTDNHVMITVTDHGQWRPPTAASDRGHGIPLMHELADEVHITIEENHPGTTVRLRWHLENPLETTADNPVPGDPQHH